MQKLRKCINRDDFILRIGKPYILSLDKSHKRHYGIYVKINKRKLSGTYVNKTKTKSLL